VFSAAAANAAAIQGTVDAFRASLGANNGVGPCAGCGADGRREINWDGVPDAFSSGGANPFLGDFFNLATGNPAGRIRGAQFSTAGSFEVSADSDSDNDGNPGPVAPLFGNHSPDNADDFAAFSAERIFGLNGSNELDVRFSVPGSPGTAAVVKGFGAVFTDVESAGLTKLEFYDSSDALLGSYEVEPFVFAGGDSFDSFSFLGVFWDSPAVARVKIVNGTYDLDLNQHANGDDAVAMDDFIYGEPVAPPVPDPWATLPALGMGIFGLVMLKRYWPAKK